MLNNIVNLLNGLEERKFESEADAVTEKDINEYGMVLIRNNDILMYNGLAIACMAVLNFETMENYVPMIVVDDSFMGLSEGCKLFTIAHELGHYNRHLTDEILLNPEYVRNLEHEFEADEYAAMQVGLANAIAGLQELKHALDVASDGLNEYGMEEMDIRINHLMEKFMVTC